MNSELVVLLGGEHLPREGILSEGGNNDQKRKRGTRKPLPLSPKFLSVYEEQPLT